MATLVQTGDTCRFLQNSAPRLGFGVDQFGNLPLPDERWTVRASRRVGEKHLDVARAHVLAIGFIRAANVTGDATHDLQGIRVVETCRSQPVGIVQNKADFGKVAGRTGRRPGKNDIFHSAATHGGWTVFTHNPTQRFQ